VFDVSADGIANVSADDTTTNEDQDATIATSSSLDDEEGEMIIRGLRDVRGEKEGY
jgi:molecular chaperone DnaK (HSP70)